jgi:hypothetical protein
MLFLLIIAHDDAFSPDEQLFADIGAWIARMDSERVRRGGNPLRPAADAGHGGSAAGLERHRQARLSGRQLLAW